MHLLMVFPERNCLFYGILNLNAIQRIVLCGKDIGVCNSCNDFFELLINHQNCYVLCIPIMSILKVNLFYLLHCL